MDTITHQTITTAFDNRRLAALRHIDYLRTAAEEYLVKFQRTDLTIGQLEAYYFEYCRLHAEADAIYESWFPTAD